MQWGNDDHGDRRLDRSKQDYTYPRNCWLVLAQLMGSYNWKRRNLPTGQEYEVYAALWTAIMRYTSDGVMKSKIKADHPDVVGFKRYFRDARRPYTENDPPSLYNLQRIERLSTNEDENEAEQFGMHVHIFGYRDARDVPENGRHVSKMYTRDWSILRADVLDKLEPIAEKLESVIASEIYHHTDQLNLQMLDSTLNLLSQGG